jgi:NAD-dependent deacetylase
MPSAADQISALLLRARRICVLTGAGVSQESGVPTFRGPGGLWRRYRPEDLATAEAFARDPILVWEWYAWRRELIHRAEPNAAHLGLVKLEADVASRGGRLTLLTQNVDGLHERAGSRNVIRLHGSIWQLRCNDCGCSRDDYCVPLDPFPPRCSCSSWLRPGVVWFGEPLPQDAWQPAAEAAAASEVFLVIGTSALVYPAASLPLVAKRSGATVVEINPDATAVSEIADMVWPAKAAKAFHALARHNQQAERV